MIEKVCGLCRWHEHENISNGRVCVNYNSDYCADWTDYEYTCEEWEHKVVIQTKQMFDIAVKAFEKFHTACIESYPNKKIVHLAKFAKKKRIRKKNVHKIFKWTWNASESW